MPPRLVRRGLPRASKQLTAAPLDVRVRVLELLRRGVERGCWVKLPVQVLGPVLPSTTPAPTHKEAAATNSVLQRE